MKKTYVLIILFIATITLFLVSPALSVAQGKLSTDACIDQLAAKTKSKPKHTHLTTLDGQKINLDSFTKLCLSHSPPCSLPDKFYYWKHEVKWVTSTSSSGPVKHKIRLYYNHLSTCQPGLSDPQKAYGDIAEFYDKHGEFMGMGIYMGKGLYFPLPYFKYSGAQRRQ